MFALIRLTFWAALVLLVIPLGQDEQDRNIDLASPLEAVGAMRLAVSDMANICERKPELCTEGKKLMTRLGVRAKEGARLAYRAFDEHFGETEDPTTTGSVSKQ